MNQALLSVIHLDHERSLLRSGAGSFAAEAAEWTAI
jgi:hypothetical protein